MMNQLVNLKMHGEVIFKIMMRRHCEIFQTLVLGKYPEGYEIYNPFIQSGDSNLLDYFNGFKLVKSNIRLIKY